MRWDLTVTQLLLLLLALPGVRQAGAAAADQPARVLVLYGADMFLPASLVQEQAARETITKGISRSVEFYFEAFDGTRLRNSDYEASLVGLLEQKLQGQRMDVIIPVHLPALEFVERHRPALWPDTPVVFVGIPEAAIQGRVAGQGITGVLAQVDLAGTVNLALRLQPDATRIVVVSGVARSDQTWIPLVHEALRPLGGKLETTYLTNDSFFSILEQVRRLPANSIVLFTTMYRDGADLATVPRDVCIELAKASTAPVYGFYDSLLGHGVVGGSMAAIEDNAREAARMAVRVLQGEPPETIPIQSAPPAVMTVDWRQMQRWGLDERRLPANSVVLFRPRGFWQQHRVLIISAVLLAVVQAVLIARLLFNRARLRRSERALDEQLRFERFISELSATFINLPPDKVDHEIEAALKRVLDVMNLDRCHLFDCFPGRETIEFIYHAESAGTLPIPSRLDASVVPWLFGEMRQGRTLSLSNVLRDLPAEATLEREYARTYGSKSILVMPVRPGRDVVQCVCFHTTKRFQVWSEELRSRLYLVGDILASVRVERQTEEALRESRERNRAILDAIPDLMFLFDKDGIYLDYHAKDSALLAVPPEAIRGRSIREVLPPELAEESMRCVETVLRTGQPEVLEYALPVAGEHRWFEARLVRSGNNKVLSVVRDITERKRTEEAFRASEERYREVVETQTDMVCRFLPDATLTFVNEAYCRYFGRCREKLLGRKYLELIPESAHEAALNYVASLKSGPEPHTIEHEVLLPDGSHGWHQWVDHPILGSNGQVVEIQGIGRDITDRKRAEEARQTLAHASRLAIVGELTAMIAHEVNQPLGAILSNADAAELLLESKSPPPIDQVQQILADIRKDDLRASEIIRRVRGLVRKREMEMQPLDLNELVLDVLHLVTGDALRRNVQIDRHLAAGLPAIRGDKVHLQQVLLNLILNGMDAMSQMPKNQRRLTLHTRRNGGTDLEIAVRDRGHGIPPDKLSRLFDSFFTTKPEGMGLGLSIARSIIEAHRGRIRAENNPSGGATFCFTLPCAENGDERNR